mgnify:CR=1 FL=1
MIPKGEFTRGLWRSIEPVYEELINHPFVTMLAKGTLPKNSFTHYLSQDVLYLKDDAVAFMNLSKRVDNASEKEFFKLMADDTIVLEQDLHTHFLTHFNVVEAKRKSPAIEAYTSFLLHHSTESSYKIAAAALLPCFWVYSSVGKSIVNQSANNNIYQKWIDTYKGGEYVEYTNRFIEIVEAYGNDATEDEKIMMQEAFMEATKLELAFFEESLLK